MNKEIKENIVLFENVKSLTKKIDLKERKRAIALIKIFEELLKNENNVNRNYQDYWNNYDNNISKVGEENDKIILGNQFIEEEKIEDYQIFKKENEEKLWDTKDYKIEEYYYTCIINSEVRYEEKEDYDAIKYLEYFSLDESEKFKNPQSYTISMNFKFKENPFFTNKELYFKAQYKNSEIIKSEGSKIDWIGTNLSYEEIEKKQKNKRTKKTRVRIVKKQKYSFFNLFDNYSDVQENEEPEEEDESCTLINIDENINEFRDIIAYSLENYLDIVKGDNGEGVDENNEDDDEPPKLVEPNNKRKSSKSSGKSGKSGKSKNPPPEPKPECNQQ